jgi:hypothetical protein
MLIGQDDETLNLTSHLIRIIQVALAVLAVNLKRKTKKI